MTGFFFSSHYTTPVQCCTQDLARSFKTSRSSGVHGSGKSGQTSRCSIVCSSPQLQAVCPFSLYPHFCMRTLHRPVDVLRRFRQDQKGQASLEPDGRDSLGLRWELCGAVWRWLDHRAILWLWGLSFRGSTECMKLCLDGKPWLSMSLPFESLILKLSSFNVPVVRLFRNGLEYYIQTFSQFCFISSKTFKILQGLPL